MILDRRLPTAVTLDPRSSTELGVRGANACMFGAIIARSRIDNLCVLLPTSWSPSVTAGTDVGGIGFRLASVTHDLQTPVQPAGDPRH